MQRADIRIHVPLLIGWVAALAIAGFDLFWQLGASGWRSDEPVYRNAATAIIEYGNWSHNLEHPLVGKYLIAASQAAFGDAAWASRLPSAVSTLLTGLVLAALAMRVLRIDAPGAAPWAGLATFVAWTLLPHPGPSFDVSRLAYLDAPMTLFVACAMYAAWRWHEAWSWRWAAAAGVASGLAVGTKLPALFLAAAFVVLVVAHRDAPARRRAGQLAGIAAIATLTTLATWAPLGADLPRALRFLLAMQGRDVNQVLEVAGRTYRDGAPIWTQAWWQWDAWPAFALVQVVALAAAWWVLPRRAAAFFAACVLLPALAYAVGGGRILPHWQATWQPAMALLVALVAVNLLGSNRARGATAVVGAAMLLVVATHAGARVRAVAKVELSDQQRVTRLLAPVDRAGRTVVDLAPAARADRALVRARPTPWDGTYHAASESQHAWITRDGGVPLEPAPDPVLQFDADNSAVVLDRDDQLRLGGMRRHDAGRFVVWTVP